MTSEAIPTKTTSLSERMEKISQSMPLIWLRIKDLFSYAILQKRIVSKIYPGIMHLMIFWGVTIQVIGTAINLMQMALFIPFVELPFPRGNGYLAYELIMDIAGIMILIGVTMAAFRRLVLKPKELNTQWDDYYAITILALLPLVGYLTEGLRMVAVNPPWAVWSPIGNMVANLFRSMGITSEQALALHPFSVVTHITLGLLLLASIPFTKFRHLVNAPLNIIFHPLRKRGELEKIDDIEETDILGVGKVEEFRSDQLLAFDSCLQCGRCEEVCPATISGMAYSPRELIFSLRNEMVGSLVSSNGNHKEKDISETLPEPMVWSCTTCGACLSVCPILINPIDEVVDIRRFESLTTGEIPKSVADTFRNMERQGNPWGMPAEDRAAWTKELNIREIAPGEETDILLFLGCAFTYDDRNKKVAKSFTHILQKLNIDVATLGANEVCCGETARRLGNEYMFQVFAKQNIEAFNSVKFDRIVTQCPHCFNTLKNEYPQFGGNFKVQHYTEYLNELNIPLNNSSENGNKLAEKVTFHDSCYLGRHNQIYSQPRNLLNQAHIEIQEFDRNKENSFCCGGGGGQMWLETDAETRINHRRLDEALEKNSEYIATACPYCLIMFDDAIRSKGIGDEIQVYDIAEILERQLSE